MRGRRRRLLYENDASIFADAGNVERIALALGTIELGALSAAERKLVIGVARFFAGALLDSEAARHELARTVLEQGETIERLLTDLQHLRRLVGE